MIKQREALIIRLQGGLYTLYDLNKKIIIPSKARGKFRLIGTNPKVGDYVEYEMVDDKNAYIIDVKERENDLNRPYIANVDQALLFFSVLEPDFNSNLLDRFLAIMSFNSIPCQIVLTKWDLLHADEKKEMNEICDYYEMIGYPCWKFSTKADAPHESSDLKAILENKITVITGQSGVGKSTLINYLAPGLKIKTSEISKALGRGKHTTRHIELIPLFDGWVADTPGFGIMDLSEMSEMDLSHSFIEFFEMSKDCRFNSCLHQNEPDCAIKNALDDKILNSRYENYLLFLEEIRKSRKW